jgi:hypothetical protein
VTLDGVSICIQYGAGGTNFSVPTICIIAKRMAAIKITFLSVKNNAARL